MPTIPERGGLKFSDMEENREIIEKFPEKTSSRGYRKPKHRRDGAAVQMSLSVFPPKHNTICHSPQLSFPARQTSQNEVWREPRITRNGIRFETTPLPPAALRTTTATATATAPGPPTPVATVPAGRGSPAATAALQVRGLIMMRCNCVECFECPVGNCFAS